MAKDEAAAAMAAKRWKKTTKAERSEFGKKLNELQWANATPEKRAAAGKRLTEARAKARKAAAKKAKKKAA
jgi:hypothetical protein